MIAIVLCNFCEGHRLVLDGAVTGAAGSVNDISVQYIADGEVLAAPTGAGDRVVLTDSSGARVSVCVTPPPVADTDTQAALFDEGAGTAPTPDVALPGALTIGGVVSGLPALSDIPVQYTIDGVAASTTTDAGGAYAIEVPIGSNVTVTPSPQYGFLVEPSSYAICGVANSVGERNFLYARGAGQVSISGSLSDLIGHVSSAQITYLVNGVPFRATTNVQGLYAVSVPAGSNVVIEPPAIENYEAAPERRALTGIRADTAAQDFQYGLPPSKALIVGHVSGLLKNADVPVDFTIDGEEHTAATDRHGVFRIIAPTGATVAIQPPFRAGYGVEPTRYELDGVRGNMFGQNFLYRVMR